MDRKRVLMIVTQDTKQVEAAFLRRALENAGVDVIHLDPSVRKIIPGAEIAPEEVAAAEPELPHTMQAESEPLPPASAVTPPVPPVELEVAEATPPPPPAVPPQHASPANVIMFSPRARGAEASSAPESSTTSAAAETSAPSAAAPVPPVAPVAAMASRNA